MTEEDSGSVFGGLSEAAGAAWDAATNVASAAWDTSMAVSQTEAGIGEHILATGAELIGAQDSRDWLDNAAVDNREAASSSIDQAGGALSDAYTDIVGE